MDETTLLGLERSVPRYTSYPTAAQFGPAVDAAQHRAWLNALPPGEDVALYAHVPYCRALCWYCACHTTVTRSPEQMEAYGDLLARELAMVARDIGGGRRLAALQLGGGTPTELGGDGLKRLADHIAARFAIDRETEISIETDPRYLTPARAAALGAGGVNRASLGVQDFSPAVQRAINRWQPVETTARAMDALRDAGIGRVNIDLVYGLPLQTPDMLAATLKQTVALGPSRIAVSAMRTCRGWRGGNARSTTPPCPTSTPARPWPALRRASFRRLRRDRHRPLRPPRGSAGDRRPRRPAAPQFPGLYDVPRCRRSAWAPAPSASSPPASARAPSA